MTRIIAIANQKGGVGKTSLAINVGSTLTEHGKRVLLVDADPQANCTRGVGVRPDESGITEILLFEGHQGHPNPASLIRETKFPNLHVLPSALRLARAELHLSQKIGGEKVLAKALAYINSYDFILIDCPPALGRLTLNALTAATHVLIPIQLQSWAFEGAQELEETMQLVHDNLNPDLQLLGVVGTFYNAQTVLSREVLALVKDRYGNQVFATLVKNSTKLGESAAAGLPINHYEPTSDSAQSYRNLTAEILERP
jgi:chromosome partitioning protein